MNDQRRFRSKSPFGGGVWNGDRRRSNSLEMRDYGWDLHGHRGDRMRSRSPLYYGNRSRSPPITHMRKMPNYGNRSRSPPIEHTRNMPNYGNRSRSPPIEHMRKIPNYGNRSRSPPIQHKGKMPNYGNGSRSPPIEHTRKMTNYGNRLPIELPRKMPNYGVDVLRKVSSLEEMHRRPDPNEYMDMRPDANAGLRDTSRVMREGLHRMLDQKGIDLEDGTSQGMYRMPADVRRPSQNIESAGKMSLTSTNMGLDRFNDERIPYPGSSLPEKFSYDKGEKPRLHINDASYSMVPPSQSMDFTGTSQFKDFGSTSSRNARVSFPTSHWDGPPLSKDEYFRDSAKLTEHIGYGDYRESHVLDSGRNPEAESRDLIVNKRGPFSPSRDNHYNYLYNRAFLGDSNVLDIGRDPKMGTNTFSPSRTNSQNYLYPRPGIEENIEMYGRSERIDYGSRENMLDPVKQLHGTAELSRRKITDSLWDHPSPEKPLLANHIGINRSSTASKQYMDTVTQGRKVLREEERPYFDDSNDRDRMLPMTSNYSHARDAGPIYYKERMRSPEFHREIEMHGHSEERMRLLEFHHDTEVHRHPVRTHGIRGEEYSTSNLSHRVPKRKHQIIDEEMNQPDPRDITRNWNGSSRTQYQDDRSEDWIHQQTRTSHSSRQVAYDREVERSQRFYDRDTGRLSAYEDRSPSYEDEHVLKRSIKGQRSGDKFFKGYLKPGSASYYDSNQYNRKNVLPKPQNVWTRSKHGSKVDVQNKLDHLENQVTFTKSEPSEDSVEFKQLVHSHYLSFTRKLNDNSSVRRRYKEQGRAGSLFCIVCGRSESKEFTDTRRLGTHAFMSRKVGLRTQHLGLHKAICVLLGWKSEVAPDVVTWFPETISNADALAQKEDLIIWPPVVVIHNTSDHGITVEALEGFIKGKGISGGKVKFANHSILVVKFLGTYSGVQDAEKLHKYFAENKRGRVDFVKITCSKLKTSNVGASKRTEGKLDELELYGYMGIAEDLDQVDLDTKRKCSIRSKKEIQDIVDAPVKPE